MKRQRLVRLSRKGVKRLQKCFSRAQSRSVVDRIWIHRNDLATVHHRRRHHHPLHQNPIETAKTPKINKNIKGKQHHHRPDGETIFSMNGGFFLILRSKRCFVYTTATFFRIRFPEIKRHYFKLRRHMTAPMSWHTPNLILASPILSVIQISFATKRALDTFPLFNSFSYIIGVYVYFTVLK